MMTAVASSQGRSLPLKSSLLLIWVILTTNCVTAKRIEKAKQLLEYNNKSKAYSIHVDGLAEIYDQTQPVVVISAVGDSRLGKSTNLNFIRHFWDGDQQKFFQKVFTTSDSTEPCTHGVWVSTVKAEQESSTLLLDVQGTDLEDNKVTDKLSMFTAMMSSAMVLFVRGTLLNHQLDFLYRIARLSELIFGDDTASLHFPQLGVIVMEPLRSTDGRSLEQSIVNKITSPIHRDGRDEEREFLASFLKGREIKVFELPHANTDTLNNFRMLIRSTYKQSIEEVTARLKFFPSKKREQGREVDGKYLVELAKTLHKTMNGNSWLELPSAFDMLEREACERSFNIAVKPLFLSTLSALESGYKAAMEQVQKSCSLQTEIDRFQTEIQNVLNQKNELTNKEKAVREENKKRANAENDLVKTKAEHAREIDKIRREVETEKRKQETSVQEYQKKQSETNRKIDSLEREIGHLKIPRKSDNGVCFSLNLIFASGEQKSRKGRPTGD